MQQDHSLTVTEASSQGPAPFEPGEQYPNMIQATYDPADNKLRLYTLWRLDDIDYKRAKDCGFSWAPKQELFFASWSPNGEDLLLEWCGEIGDENTSLADRAADRAKRFEGYKANRERDGDNAHRSVVAITEHIPLGQPILVGHHSEKHARKDAEKIENGMRKAVKMWETAAYWEQRASGAIASADYRDTPTVRARRIKRLEAEHRKRTASYTPHGPEFMQEPENECWREEQHPRDETCERCERCLHVMTGNKGIGSWPSRVDCLPAIERGQSRWIAHLERRLSYEKTLLKEQGASALLEPQKRPKQPPILNYRAEGGQVKAWQKYGDSAEILKQKEMTKSEYKAIYSENRWTVLSEDKSHRLRFATIGGFSGPRVVVFLTDSKEHPQPSVSV